MTAEEKAGLRVADRIYTALEDSGPDEYWNLNDVWNRFHKHCKRSEELKRGAIASFVTRVVDLVDQRHTKRRAKKAAEEQGLFWADLGGSHALLDGKRIAKRHAKLDDMRIVLKIHDANTHAQVQANQELHEEFERLEPYMQDPTVTKEKAVGKWLEDHPFPNAG
jgi:hypothetical protein